jgi:predicted transcriptional regulator
METNELDNLTAQIVAAYVSNNAVPANDLPHLIGRVRAAFPSAEPITPPEELKPAVSVKKSVTPSHIICLEDGKKFKSLTRHLRTHYDLTPAEYRLKWGLPKDYPMVAPEYAAKRSQLAKDMGLGRKAA